MRKALLWLLLIPGLAYGRTPKTEEKVEVDMELLEHKYEFLGKDRRDPFTIWKPQVVTEDRELDMSSLAVEPVLRPGAVGRGGTKPSIAGPDPAVVVEQARQYLFSGRLEAAVQSCNEALKLIEERGNVAGVASIEEGALRVLRAAERLKFRRETEEAFKKLPIVIRGIVWQPENSFAIVNDSMAREGTIIQGGARVFKILPREVVFIYNGLKVSRKLYEEGKADAAKKKVKSRRNR